MAKIERTTVGEKVSSYMESREKILITILVVLVVAIVSYVVCISAISKSNEKGLSALDAIEYSLTVNSSELSEEELDARRTVAIAHLQPYVSKSRVVGVRANLLAGEISYSKKDYQASAKYYFTAAEKDKKAYTAPIAYFNAGVSFENVEDFENAEKCYKAASESPDFLSVAHAYFSLGRVRESMGNVDGAIEAYKALNDKSPDSSWGNLAKSRLIALENN